MQVLFYSLAAVLRIRMRDPGSGAFWASGCGMVKKTRSESGILDLFDPELWIQDGKIRSRNKHPATWLASRTVQGCYYFSKTLDIFI
jgi:hypothetical protein